MAVGPKTIAIDFKRRLQPMIAAMELSTGTEFWDISDWQTVYNALTTMDKTLEAIIATSPDGTHEAAWAERARRRGSERLTG